MECVLLKESQADDSGDFQNQLLIVRQYVASDQLDDFQKTALLIQKCHQAVSIVHEFRRYIVLIPGRQVI